MVFFGCWETYRSYPNILCLLSVLLKQYEGDIYYPEAHSLIWARKEKAIRGLMPRAAQTESCASYWRAGSMVNYKKEKPELRFLFSSPWVWE
ncbi:hypothetical protein TEQG_05087 [Trichophyton equinum CBS 127.97]|uniref:Uncharacterized protein n=1 Tax=Trichophyton equinum (strain ATCC MYA-4606 / CBS 127.97) TaxID=559882 RepID=F2PWC3_TRIEC|nr:hypothetical protein TEQG_05087 [Trichophyton equinum CBS 127.97]